MDQEKLSKGKKLAGEIESAKGNLRCWQEATAFGNSAIYIQPNNVWLSVSPETFTIVKAINIQHLMNEIASLEKEFSEL